jgi:DNA-binding GntR family transcriptional regulator
VTATTYERIRRLILEAEHDDPVSLTEATLAERMGVSRTPVREALKRLEQEGLVERSGRSIRVRERSPEEILEIYEVRIILEAAVARGAALRRTALDLSRLEAIHEQMLALKDEDLAVRIGWNTRYHDAMRTAGHNATLEDVITRLISHLHRYPQSTLAFPGRWERILGEHEDILAAIRDGDADRAAKAASDHMTVARDTRLRMFARELDHT